MPRLPASGSPGCRPTASWHGSATPQARSAATPGHSQRRDVASPTLGHNRPRADTLPPGLADHPDYEILRELGRGGMGVVYLAHNRLMGRDEVLKVMGRQIMERPGVLDRFLREIRCRRQAPPPEHRHGLFRLPPRRERRLRDGIRRGLRPGQAGQDQGPAAGRPRVPTSSTRPRSGSSTPTRKGMVHRDIKPGNLMLSRKGNKAVVKILDFGLAKATREGQLDGA